MQNDSVPPRSRGSIRFETVYIVTTIRQTLCRFIQNEGRPIPPDFIRKASGHKNGRLNRIYAYTLGKRSEC